METLSNTNSTSKPPKYCPNQDYTPKKDTVISKKMEHLAQTFSKHYKIPRETSFNNKRSSKYFSSKEKPNSIGSHSNNSTLKDTLIETVNKKQHTRGHKKSLSKTYYIINNNTIVSKVEVLVEKTSTTKILQQVPSKKLDDSVDDIKTDDCMENGSDIYMTENEIAFDDNNLSSHKEDKSFDKNLNEKLGKIYKILNFYEKLGKNFTNFALFLLKYKENFEFIEKWFDLTTNFNLINKKSENNSSSNAYLNIYKKFQIYEVVLLGFIINLYEMIRNHNIMGNNSYFILYNHFKTGLQYLNNIIIRFTKDILDTQTNNTTDISNIETLIKEKIKNMNNTVLNEEELIKIEKIIIKCIEKFESVCQELKDKEKEKMFNSRERSIPPYEENGISLDNYLSSDLRNLEYVSSIIKNSEKIKYEDIREMVYNEYLLGNLVKVNLMGKEDSFEDYEECEIEEDEIKNGKIDESRENGENENYNQVEVNNEMLPCLSPSQFQFFLPEMDITNYNYTLVLDLDETLVHYMEEGDEAYVQVRPYAEFFINELSKYYEIVIFTAATEDYADIVLNELDRKKVISFKLYRRHTEQKNNVYIKDISKLGRNLKKTIIIDNVKDNFSLHPENGLHIVDFLGNDKDCELRDLFEDLRAIVVNQSADVRVDLESIREKMSIRYGRTLRGSSQK